jgi:hypothetical protein
MVCWYQVRDKDSVDTSADTGTNAVGIKMQNHYGEIT